MIGLKHCNLKTTAMTICLIILVNTMNALAQETIKAKKFRRGSSKCP